VALARPVDLARGTLAAVVDPRGADGLPGGGGSIRGAVALPLDPRSPSITLAFDPRGALVTPVLDARGAALVAIVIVTAPVRPALLPVAGLGEGFGRKCRHRQSGGECGEASRLQQ